MSTILLNLLKEPTVIDSEGDVRGNWIHSEKRENYGRFYCVLIFTILCASVVAWVGLVLWIPSLITVNSGSGTGTGSTATNTSAYLGIAVCIPVITVCFLLVCAKQILSRCFAIKHEFDPNTYGFVDTVLESPNFHV